MSLFIRDAEIDALADELMRRLGTKSKSEAVLRALQNELMRADDKRPLVDRVSRIQDRVASRLGKDPSHYDDKAYMDAMWEV
ncbi:type II toxin-antitoxin system VapB family antitoxin [Affinirhizobium pseudoryzae]|uniref:type II toxin-antitoxin system VapB family antitoxin n=1 Tax=Allorhizobium pseudoryzae TaxID=379684 RepID=UPI0013ED7AB4|nr:type II toxin-antitoxin system VapB family antitoxin [Allorhizobium pseudoryzae]